MSFQEGRPQIENWPQEPPIPVRTVIVKLVAPLPLVVVLLPFVNFMSNRNIGWYLFSYTILVLVVIFLLLRVIKVLKTNFGGLWASEIPSSLNDPDDSYLKGISELAVISYLVEIMRIHKYQNGIRTQSFHVLFVRHCHL